MSAETLRAKLEAAAEFVAGPVRSFARRMLEELDGAGSWPDDEPVQSGRMAPGHGKSPAQRAREYRARHAPSRSVTLDRHAPSRSVTDDRHAPSRSVTLARDARAPVISSGSPSLSSQNLGSDAPSQPTNKDTSVTLRHARPSRSVTLRERDADPCTSGSGRLAPETRDWMSSATSRTGQARHSGSELGGPHGGWVVQAVGHP